MSMNAESDTNEPLIQPARSLKMRQSAIITIASVALIAISFAILIRNSGDNDFLEAKNQVSLVGIFKQISLPGQNYANIFVGKNEVIGLTYKLGKNYALSYKVRVYNPSNGAWNDYPFPVGMNELKVNSEGKRLIISNSNDGEMGVQYTEGPSYSVYGIQDGALESNGKVHAIVMNETKNISEYRDFLYEKTGVQLYSNQIYRNIEVYQDKVVLVKVDGTLEDFKNICVKEISAGAENEGGLFALSCEQHPLNELYQLLRWNNKLNDWEKVDDIFGEKLAAQSNSRVYVLSSQSVIELTINE
ncbi:UNKNOWN [Stylonychia lemnae]|uniref:Uncharacterized protein n=1 Tax=Stylonychia lemnae TaxID=5949 RepID=A0A078ASM1_STYLE|nr:UNKNOWN [Stylonychia lemnae]|eukprot:CDW84986.1 UNKNOWN [Stylonychia lemnae]